MTVSLTLRTICKTPTLYSCISIKQGLSPPINDHEFHIRNNSPVVFDSCCEYSSHCQGFSTSLSKQLLFNFGKKTFDMVINNGISIVLQLVYNHIENSISNTHDSCHVVLMNTECLNYVIILVWLLCNVKLLAALINERTTKGLLPNTKFQLINVQMGRIPHWIYRKCDRHK